jgi:UDP-GlcNAc:undecaprenyl-phosphate GlcNAc-1-phosphate transferase
LFLAVWVSNVRFPANQIIITWMVPLCVLALPILDTALVSISRLRRGKNPLTHGGKDHISHRLVQLGLTRREAVLTCYLLAGIGGMVASYAARRQYHRRLYRSGLSDWLGAEWYRLSRAPCADY